MTTKWKKIEQDQVPVWNDKDDEGKFVLKENDELVGKFNEVKTDLGPNKATLYFFKKEDGSEVSVWGSTVLNMRFKNLKIGEDVKVIYLGEVANKIKGRAPYRNYEVYHSEHDESDIPVIEEDDPRYNQIFNDHDSN